MQQKQFWCCKLSTQMTLWKKTEVLEWFSRFKNKNMYRLQTSFWTSSNLQKGRKCRDSSCNFAWIPKMDHWSNCEVTRPDFCQTGDWFFLHDNASAHAALPVWQSLTKNCMFTLLPPTHLILLSVTLFCLYEWRGTSKNIVLTTCKMWRKESRSLQPYSQTKFNKVSNDWIVD